MLRADEDTAMQSSATDTPTDILGLAQQRLDWAARRERVLAQNIANSDTPGYRPQDIAPFKSTLGSFTLPLAMTNARDLPGSGDAASGGRVEQTVDARAPDGNAVSITDELARVADTDTTHRTVTDIYQKYMGMFMTALDAKG